MIYILVLALVLGVFIYKSLTNKKEQPKKDMGGMTKHAKEIHDKMSSHEENDKWSSTNEIDAELKNNGGFSDPLGGDGYNAFEEQALP